MPGFKVAARWMTATGVIAISICCLCSPVPAQPAQPCKHPALTDAPRLTQTKRKISGDPINVALVGTETQVVQAMLRAGWLPADPITLKTSLHIAASTVFHRPYVDAPVSNLYLWKRKQDLAFEQPVGKDARRRHHVRFWMAEKKDEQGRPLWLGSATYDTRVEISHTTHLPTHRIAADIDTERDKLMDDLRSSRKLEQFFWVDSFQQTLQGRNGGGDPYHTDGRLAVGILMPAEEGFTIIPAKTRTKRGKSR